MTNCAACHYGARVEGKFDVSKFWAMSPAEKAVVRERLTTSDLKKRMPRNPDGTAAPPLSPSEIAKWFPN